MSMKLVKKLLQDHEKRDREGKEAAAADGTKNNKHRRKRKRSSKDEESQQQVNDEDALKATVRNLLFLDKKMDTLGGSKKNAIVKRIKKESHEKTKNRQQAATSVMGNSRASSSQLRLAPAPTFNKKRHKKEKEEARLQKIAKLLNKSASKKQKAKAV